ADGSGDQAAGSKVDPLGGDNIICSIRGKGKLRGGEGADEFKFDVFDYFAKKQADKIIDFNSQEGDFLNFTHCALGSISNQPISFTTAKNKQKLKLLSRKDYDFVYFQKKGRLFWDSNGATKNWGTSSEGGLIAILKGKPELTAESISVLG
ncbi:MAG TPA: hypothetical protein DIT98_18795, partial [Verrucomicrobiales bacterium]|nr:hypothetical protein [Verrucomicrobiales bacterium]